MASWIIHLRVAQQLYRKLNIESINEFVLANEIVYSAKEKQSVLFHTNRELFWQTIKKDWYDLDFMYLKSNPSFEAFCIYRESKDIRNTYVDFFSENAFEERRSFILSFYADGVANIEEHNTYLSKEELDVFVTSAVNEIITQLQLDLLKPLG